MGTRDHPNSPNHPYFVTAVTKDRRPIFRDDRAAELMVTDLRLLRDELGFSLVAYVVMPDHVHLLVVPGEGSGVSRIMQLIKGRFARSWNKAIGSAGSVWQPRFFESVVRTETQLVRWIEYIQCNPVEARLVQAPEDYPYCSAGGSLPTDTRAYLGGVTRSRAEARPSGEVIEP